ncbi:Peptide deformylase [Sergentomyia squamirostris]
MRNIIVKRIPSVCAILTLNSSKHHKIKNIHTCCANFLSWRDFIPNIWVPRTIQPPYRHVVQIGDPVLRQKAENVPEEEITSEAMKYIYQRMVNTMTKFKLSGISAPQVGVPLRVVAFEFTKKYMQNYGVEVAKTRNMQLLPLTLLVNPKLKVTDFTKQTFPEGCGSLAGFTADVTRYSAVEVTGFDQNGVRKTIQLDGWNARIAQHEMDHLEGVMFSDLMDRKTLQLIIWPWVNAREGRIEMKYYG